MEWPQPSVEAGLGGVQLDLDLHSEHITIMALTIEKMILEPYLLVKNIWSLCHISGKQNSKQFAVNFCAELSRQNCWGGMFPNLIEPF